MISPCNPSIIRKSLYFVDLTTFYFLGQKFVKFFVGILVKTMTPKGYFEINWPLVRFESEWFSWLVFDSLSARFCIFSQSDSKKFWLIFGSEWFSWVFFDNACRIWTDSTWSPDWSTIEFSILFGFEWFFWLFSDFLRIWTFSSWSPGEFRFANASRRWALR